MNTKIDHNIELVFNAPQISQVAELTQPLINETRIKDNKVVITATPNDFATTFQFI